MPELLPPPRPLEQVVWIEEPGFMLFSPLAALYLRYVPFDFPIPSFLVFGPS
jgi:hypothetical protein